MVFILSKGFNLGRILDLFGAYPFWLHSWNYLCCLCYHQVIDHIHHFNFGWTMNNLSN
ncbi:hypothetical protein glysoja_001960 [Glycine soja]|nr:hypothetical protein glysoja_001960 [Glycine soja]